MSSPEEPITEQPPPVQDRREFVKGAACAVLGGCALIPAIGAAVVVLAKPLSARAAPVAVKLTLLSALPPDGVPRLFQVVTERSDAWTKFPANAIGAVFLRRLSESDVVAFHAACPHLGCAVEFRTERDIFYCPCHDSEFAKDGAVRGQSPSRRGLDRLRVEIREGGEVWVHFENFKAGIAEKIPLA
jgi:Rieske Fe-S protein